MFDPSFHRKGDPGEWVLKTVSQVGNEGLNLGAREVILSRLGFWVIYKLCDKLCNLFERQLSHLLSGAHDGTHTQTYCEYLRRCA